MAHQRPARDTLAAQVAVRGATIDAMAKHHRVSATMIRTWLAFYRLPTPAQAARPTRAQLEAAVREPEATMESVAARFGMSTDGVRHWLTAAGLPTPAQLHGRRKRVGTRGVLATRDLDDIVAAYLDDQRTLADIGNELGISRERVRQLLLRVGVTGRQRTPAHQRGKLADAAWLTDQVQRGVPMTMIAAEAGVSPTTLAKRLNELGVSRTRYRRMSCPYPERELRRRYIDERTTQKDLAEQLGVSVSLLARWLRELGIPTRSRVDLDHVDQLTEQGWTVSEIARHVGFSVAGIRRAQDAADLSVLCDPDHVRELLADATLNLADAAEILGVSADGLRLLCVRSGITFPVRDVPDDELADVVLVSGSITRLAVSAGQAPQRLRARALELGLTAQAFHRQGEQRSLRRQQALDLHAEGFNAAEIAQLVGADASTIRRDLYQMGVPTTAGTWVGRRAAQQRRQDRGLPARTRDAAIFQALADGLSKSAISSSLGVGYSRINRLQARRDVAAHPSSGEQLNAEGASRVASDVRRRRTRLMRSR